MKRLLTICASMVLSLGLMAQGKLLHNGIRLPEQWPPKYPYPSERKAMPVPYLEDRPEVIPVNVGRQLFVDDFLIESTDLQRVNHHARMYEGNPIIVADRPWDFRKGGDPYADPYSGGVWYDEQDGLFKVWYRGGFLQDGDQTRTCTSYAVSEDGIHWTKPVLDVVPGTNIIDTCKIDSRSVWLDKLEKDPSKRFKYVGVNENDYCHYVLKYSADGIHWSEPVAMSGKMQDRSTVNYNPFTGKWVANLRIVTMVNLRSRAYMEDDSLERLLSRVTWEQDKIDKTNDGQSHIAEGDEMTFWFSSDDQDLRHPDPAISDHVAPAIYNFDMTAYESIMLGQYSVWRGPDNWECEQKGIQKLNEFCVGYSRDGFHFSRPDHTAFMESVQEPGVWNYGNMQPAIGNPCIVGDSLYFYCGGHRLSDIHWDGATSTGLGVLRRDGFVSMRAVEDEGVLTTRVITFDGSHLFVNAAAGMLAVEVLDEDGHPIKGFDRSRCRVQKDMDSTRQLIGWKGRKSLAKLAGRRVRLRFYLTDGDLYAFWISPWRTGESRGYLGGGGPGLNPSGIDLPVK